MFKKSNHTWFGAFGSRFDAGLLFQRAFADERHNAPDYGDNARQYGFNAGAPAVVYSAQQSRNYQPWLLIGRSQRHHSATRSRFMSAHYAVVFVECGGAPPPFSIG